MRKEVVGYFLAGYPEEDSSIELMRDCAKAGMHIIEVGYPSSSPCFDGDIIAAAHKKVMADGAPDLSYFEKLRESVKCPIWLMAYKSDFVDTGLCAEFARRGLADVLVLPDSGDELRAKLNLELSGFGTVVLGFASVETPEDELRRIMSRHSIIYFQLYLGKTGSPDVGEGDVSLALKVKADFPDVKMYAGFGVNTPERCRELVESGFDGAIVGTAVVRELNNGRDALLKFAGEIVEAVQ